MYRQSKELYGTWEMLCGNEVQVRRLWKSPQGPESGAGHRDSGLGVLPACKDSKITLDRWRDFIPSFTDRLS